MHSTAYFSKKSALFVILIIFNAFFLAQAQSKVSDDDVIHIACSIDSCMFAVQSTSDEEVKFDYGMHSSLFHKKLLSEAEKRALLVNGRYTPRNPLSKSIACPGKDGYAIWSNYEDVLVNFYKQHSQFIHEKILKDRDIRKMIQSVH